MCTVSNTIHFTTVSEAGSLFLQVWSGQTQNTEDLLSTGCGSVAPDPIIAPRNIITSRFQATEATGRGFSASFSTSKYQADCVTHVTIDVPYRLTVTMFES